MAQARPGRRTPGEETAPSELGSPGWLLGQVWGKGCWQPRKRGPGDVSLGGKQGGDLCLSCWCPVPRSPGPVCGCRGGRPPGKAQPESP